MSRKILEQLDMYLHTYFDNKNGIVYTPTHIVDYMIKNSQINPDWNILEPSCGHGIFVFSLIDYMFKEYFQDWEKTYIWFIEHVIATDINEKAIDDLSVMLNVFFTKHGIKSPVFKNILKKDSLFYNFDKKFDLVIGNPPYIRNKNIDILYLQQIRKKFLSCRFGNIDLYYAFIENALQISKKIMFIVPNSFIYNKSAKTLRNIICEKIVSIIDFKEKNVFENAKIYTSIIHLDAEKKDCNIKYKNSIEENYVHTEVVCDSNQLFSEDSTITEDNITIYSGIATLSDTLFKVEKYDNDMFLTKYNGQDYFIEKDIVIPCLKMTKIKNQDSSYEYIIFPYDKDNKIIDETDFYILYPNAYNYMCAIFNDLMKRDRGKTEKYENWYAYGRKQGLHKIESKDIIIIPKMINYTCRPIIYNIENIIDIYKRFVFTSGYIIPLNEVTEKYKKFLLSDDFILNTINIGKIWPGKNENFYAITSTQLREIITKNN